MPVRRPEAGFSVCVAGVPGVGKSLLMREHAERGELLDRQLTGSSVIKAIIAPATVQEFDTWPEAERTAVREEAIIRLRRVKAETPGRLLIDGHFTLRNRHTRMVDAVFTDGDRMFYDALVLLQSSPDRVLHWRAGDSRDRGPATLEEIAEHLECEQDEGQRLAARMSVPLLVLGDDDLEGRLVALRSFLDEVASLAA